ncbi:MAG: flavodoxin domain-containing protein [Alteromonadaceae bacterium]|nr:flavodoxin domain-containing protein [Alteromonadaceae bacterium]MBL4908880.1 flavodoxin domain-containing protein [Alteromonadaceae bacterium]
MASFQIIVGSMLGGTEYVAEACEETLIELGHQVKVHLQPQFGQIPSNNQIWLICTSTHGAGEHPDNIKNFIEDLTKSDQDLSTCQFLVIGVGDSSYDTFCLAAKNTEKLLISNNCKKITPLFTIDMQANIDPELLAQQHMINKKDLLY